MSYQSSFTETQPNNNMFIVIILTKLNKIIDIENKVNSTSQQMVIIALYK